MGIMNAIFGNVSEMDIAGLQKEFGALLCDGERIERAYKLIRDKWVFTNKRLIIQDIQGVTGKKKRISVCAISFHRTFFGRDCRNIRHGCRDENLDKGKRRTFGTEFR